MLSALSTLSDESGIFFSCWWYCMLWPAVIYDQIVQLCVLQITNLVDVVAVFVFLLLFLFLLLAMQLLFSLFCRVNCVSAYVYCFFPCCGEKNCFLMNLTIKTVFHILSFSTVFTVDVVFIEYRESFCE